MLMLSVFLPGFSDLIKAPIPSVFTFPNVQPHPERRRPLKYILVFRLSSAMVQQIPLMTPIQLFESAALRRTRSQPRTSHSVDNSAGWV